MGASQLPSPSLRSGLGLVPDDPGVPLLSPQQIYSAHHPTTVLPNPPTYLPQLYEKFRPGQKPPEGLGPNRDYNVDLVPKFMMANGKLVRVLLHTGVVKYMEFKAVDGSYVLSKGKIEKVPASDMEALKSSLLGLFEKRRAGKFFRCAKQAGLPGSVGAHLYGCGLSLLHLSYAAPLAFLSAGHSGV